MILISQLLGKQLLDKNTALCYGTICNMSLDDSRLILHTESHAITADRIHSISDVAVCTNCNMTVAHTPLLGIACYTDKGLPLGNITNMQLSATLKCKKLTTDRHTFTTGKVLCIGDVLLTKQLPAPPPATTTPIQYGNCDWLLGRICYKNITNYHNEIIVHMGQLISRHTIDSCKSAYKLRELIVNSR